jgi:hypothetical protein
MATKRKASTTKRSRRADLAKSKRALQAGEKQLRALLKAGLRKGPAGLLALHVELVSRLRDDLEARVAGLRWYQEIVRDVIAKAGS